MVVANVRRMFPLLHPAVLPCADHAEMLVEVLAGGHVGWPGLADALPSGDYAYLVGAAARLTPRDGVLRCAQIDDPSVRYAKITDCAWRVPAPDGPPAAVDAAPSPKYARVGLTYECPGTPDARPMVLWDIDFDAPAATRAPVRPAVATYIVDAPAAARRPAWLGNAHADATRRDLAAAVAALDTCGERCSDTARRWRETLAGVLASEAWTEEDRRPVRPGAGTKLPRAGVAVRFATALPGTTVVRTCAASTGEDAVCHVEVAVYESPPFVYRFDRGQETDDLGWEAGGVRLSRGLRALTVHGDALRVR